MSDFPGFIPAFETKAEFRDELDPSKRQEFINGTDLNEIYDEIVCIAKNLGANFKFEPCLSGTQLTIASGTAYIKTKRIEYAGDIVTISGSGYFWVDNTSTLMSGLMFPSGTEFIPVAQVTVSGSVVKLIDERFFPGASFPVSGSDLTYTPDDAGDWPAEFGGVPGDFQDAVDILADRVSEIEPFGRDYFYSEDDPQDSTGSGTYVERHTLAGVVTASGTYHIGWSFEYSGDRILPQAISARVQVDDATTIGEIDTALVILSGSWNMASGFKRVALGAGSHDIDLDYRADTPGDAFIRRARIEMWRVP